MGVIVDIMHAIIAVASTDNGTVVVAIAVVAAFVIVVCDIEIAYDGLVGCVFVDDFSRFI